MLEVFKEMRKPFKKTLLFDGFLCIGTMPTGVFANEAEINFNKKSKVS